MWRIAILVLVICSNLVNGEPQVPCHFIFGDSLSDPGNNNNLITMAKANYPPYGVDFPEGATGRFTNGLTIVDVITQLLGFDRLIPKFSNITQDIMIGVNFASEAAGILPETGSNLGDRMPLDQQLQNYQRTVLRLQTMVQGPVSSYLNKCLYTVNIGSDDYINNYFLPQFFNTSRRYTPEQFAELLIARYKTQLQTLYDSGARKLAVFGLGLIGCTPAEMTRYNSTLCVAEINQAIDIFNKKLVSLVDNFNANLPGLRPKFTFIDFAAIQSLDPLATSLVLNSTCCQVRRTDFQCEPYTTPCTIRSLFAFYDGLHPTQLLNTALATVAYTAPLPLFAHPVDISQLVGNLVIQQPIY